MIIQLELEDAKKELADLIEQIGELGNNINIADAEKQYRDYSDKINSDGFWDDVALANETLKNSKLLSEKIKDFRDLENAAVSV